MVLNKCCLKCGNKLVWNDYVYDKPCPHCGAIPSEEKKKNKEQNKDKPMEKGFLKMNKELTESQKLLIQGLKLKRINDDAIIGIVISLQEIGKTDEFIDYLADNGNLTLTEMLKKITQLAETN